MDHDAYVDLFDVPGGWRETQVDFPGVTLRMLVPADPDRVLDAHLESQAAEGSETDREPPDPYWATLWSAATPTATAVFHADWKPGARILELGCGAGLAGVAALSRGYRVTFSDICLQAVQVARANALRNGFVTAEAMVLDWYHPPEMTFDILLASDVLYHRASHNCLLQAIEQMLAPDGECWIGDPGRVNAREFFHSASRSFEVHLYDREGKEFWVPQVGDYQRFTLRRRRVSAP
jgi:predicted nicotinamide N-methyase